MIYLILSAGFKDDDSLEKLLKIGYTEDNNLDRRIYQYKSHNPTIKLLYTIPEGTKNLEDLLHSRFYSFRYDKFGKEWFNYSEEIMQFFEMYNTAEDMSEVLDPDLLVGSKSKFSGFTKYCHSIIDHCLNYKMKLDSTFTIDQAMNEKSKCYEELIKSGLVLKEGVSKFILGYFNITNDQYLEYINIEQLDEVLKFIKEFNTLPTFYDKMRAICESPFIINETIRRAILEQVPISFKNFYNKLGPIVLKSCGYNITNIRKRIETDFLNNENIGNVSSLIYNSFNVGDKYLLSYIKEKLGELYNLSGYISSPKASDLEKYFEVKKVLIPNKSTGKRDSAYEILKKKG